MTMKSAARLILTAVTLAAAFATMTTEPVLAGEQGAANRWHEPTNGFARSSPWNTRLPARIPLDPRSREIVANLKADKDNSYAVWPLVTDTFSAPIYTVGPDAPVQTWKDRWSSDECFNTGAIDPEFVSSLAAVPTLPDMITSNGTDNEIAIYQPSTDTYWDFWRARVDDTGQWSACWGGKIEHYSKNPGIHRYPLGGVEWHSILNGIPVDRLQALPLDYGKPRL